MTSALDEALAVLRRGGVVACPTETLVGLLADASRAEVVGRVAAIKGRADDSPIALILPDVGSVELFAEPLGGVARELADEHWPGPLTLVVRARTDVPARLVRDGKIGVRVPSPSLALDLVRAFGKPLTATSANPAGAPAPSSTRALDPSIRSGVDYVLEGDSPGGAPSTVVDATVEPPRILRAGAVSLPRI
jgi:L-threonylcarbamoyladenylate synthase